jgi:hypothetical protein
VRELTAAFSSAGLAPGQDYVYHEVPGGEYSETGWQSRVEPMLTFFFKPEKTSAAQGSP